MLGCGFYYMGAHHAEEKVEFEVACGLIANETATTEQVEAAVSEVGGWVWGYWGADICGLDHYDKWIVSIYWAFVTVTTVRSADCWAR